VPGRGVVCCPDSFKGVLSAADAAAVLAAGFRSAGIDALELPLADGGEGTAEALSFRDGEWRSATVSDPLGRPVEARFLMRGDGAAVVEAAEAVGLWRLARDELDPIGASSRGLGELLLAAVDAGARRVTVALGGTATVDGGAGMREVLDRLPVPVTAACDVRNPLLGPRGAARAFGPQKGATPDQVEELERRLASMPELASVAELPGAGSAGGLGAAFAALGAELVPGVDLILRELDFDAVLAGGVALAVTGEGRVDPSSAEGKVAAGVARACARRYVPCVVVGGTVAAGAERALYELGATAVLALSGDPERCRADLAAYGEALGRLLGRLAAS
jgi:glycerate kinase